MIRFLTERMVLAAADELLAAATGPVLITSGWVRGVALDALFTRRARERLREGRIAVRLVYRLSEPQDLAITELDRLEELAREVGEERLAVRYSRSLHAKILVAPEGAGQAIVSSSNLTPAGGYSRRVAEGRGEWGNQEAGVLTDDPETVAAAASHFETIWQEAHRIEDGVVGLAVECPSHEGLAVACITEVRAGQYLVVEDGGTDRRLLGRVGRVVCVDPSFPPLFGSEEGGEGMQKALGGAGAVTGGKEWQADRTIAALMAEEPKVRGLLMARSYRRPGAAFRLASVDLLREMGERMEPVTAAPVPGSLVRRARLEEFERLVNGGREASGEHVEPLVLGHVHAQPELAVRLDPQALLGVHAAVLGMTGSGKSTAVRRLLSGVVPWAEAAGARVVVLDPHGEYGELARSLGGRVVGREGEFDRVPVTSVEELLDLAGLETQDRHKRAVLAHALARGRNGGVGAFLEAIGRPGGGPPVRFWERLGEDGLLGEAALRREVSERIEAAVAARQGLDRRRTGDREEAAAQVGEILERQFPAADLALLKEWFAAREAERLAEGFLPAPPLGEEDRQAIEAVLPRLRFDPPALYLADRGLTVVDLRSVTDADARAAVAGAVATRLFGQAKGDGRRAWLVVEEAQQFAPEHTSRRRHRSLGPLLEVAAEGRKFGVHLVAVTQRPASLSKGVLTQCAMQWIFRMANPADLEQVEAAVEAAAPPLLRLIPGLAAGACLACGGPFALPLLVNVRAE